MTHVPSLSLIFVLVMIAHTLGVEYRPFGKNERWYGSGSIIDQQ